MLDFFPFTHYFLKSTKNVRFDYDRKYEPCIGSIPSIEYILGIIIISIYHT